MLFTAGVRRALSVAARQHDGQYRKSVHVPFIIHPVEVALLVSLHSSSEETIISALLHDVIEDTKGYNLSQMERDFGPTVSQYVSLLTEDPSSLSLSWDERHGLQAKKFETAPDAVILIALADKYANLSSGPPLDPSRLWYYRQIASIARSRPSLSQLSLLADLDNLIISQSSVAN